MAEAIPPIIWEPDDEVGGVLLIWAGWAGWAALLVLAPWGPEEVLEELLEELEVREEEAATVWLRWDSRELSKVCSDRYGAK